MNRFLRIAVKIAVLAVLVILVYGVIIVARSRIVTDSLIAARLSSPQTSLRLSDFPEGWIDILVAVEDPAFYEHSGLVFSRLFEEPGTITQRLVNDLYFEEYSPGLAKLEQILIAYLALDPKIGKETQLTLFVNNVSFGSGQHGEIRGFAQASEALLYKPFSTLTQEEYLSLVAMIASPERYHLHHARDANLSRVMDIRRMTGIDSDSGESEADLSARSAGY